MTAPVIAVVRGRSSSRSVTKRDLPDCRRPRIATIRPRPLRRTSARSAWSAAISGPRPQNSPLAQLDNSDRTLWVDVIVVHDEEPLDDIGQRVLRATVVDEDRIQVAISEAHRARFAESLADLLGRLRPDQPGGDHVHLEWYHPIEDAAGAGEHSPYIAWVFGIPPEIGAD